MDGDNSLAANFEASLGRGQRGSALRTKVGDFGHRAALRTKHACRMRRNRLGRLGRIGLRDWNRSWDWGDIWRWRCRPGRQFFVHLFRQILRQHCRTSRHSDPYGCCEIGRHQGRPDSDRDRGKKIEHCPAPLTQVSQPRTGQEKAEKERNPRLFRCVCHVMPPFNRYSGFWSA